MADENKKRVPVLTLKEELKTNIVDFLFTKKNGTRRRAVGTLIPTFLPATKGGAPKPNVVYYDIPKGNWRSIAKKVKTVTVYSLGNSPWL